MNKVDVIVLDEPDDATFSERSLIRGRFVMNAIFAAYGDPKRGIATSTLNSAEIEAALAMALALLHSSDKGLSSPLDFRQAADHVAKNIRKNAIEIRKVLSDDDQNIGSISTTWN